MESVITRFSRVTNCDSIKKLQSKILKFQILQKEVIVAKLEKVIIGVLKFDFFGSVNHL